MNVSWNEGVASQAESPLIPAPPVSAGNGPSGICLSYLLSGHIPYVKPGAIHPNPLLQRKLTEAPGVSILDQVSLTHERGRGILGKSQGSQEGQAQNRGAHHINHKTGKEQLGSLPRPHAMSAVCLCIRPMVPNKGLPLRTITGALGLPEGPQ